MLEAHPIGGYSYKLFLASDKRHQAPEGAGFLGTLSWLDTASGFDETCMQRQV